MNVKRFEGSTMAEALAKVKGELGSQAVILHTRSYRRGGLMGFGARQIVEITAGANANIPERRRKTAPGAAHALRAAYARPSVSPNAASPSATAVAEPPDRTGFATTRQLAAAMLKEPAFEIRNEIAGLRTMVESLLQRTARLGTPAHNPDLPAELSRAYLALIEQQVADEIALRVVEDLKAELPPDQRANPAAVREQLIARLAALVPQNVPPSVARPPGAAGCRSICLIGPTGVGKTTTIAKLAAAFKLRQKQKVGLITIDTYRIAAVDQLRTYANIIGVPVKVVLTPPELLAAMKEFADCDVVLIDTAGRSPADDLKLNELSGFIQAAQPTEVHLVLASTCSQAAMEAALARFGRVRVDQIIFTKLDEAVSFGVLLNVARKASKALSYITTGQDVPDHVEVGQPRRLARLILGEKL